MAPRRKASPGPLSLLLIGGVVSAVPLGAFNEKARPLGLVVLQAAGFDDLAAAPMNWSDVTEHAASWLRAGYSPTMIVGETRMIADTSGHTKLLRYFETTFARMHRQNILDSARPRCGRRAFAELTSGKTITCGCRLCPPAAILIGRCTQSILLCQFVLSSGYRICGIGFWFAKSVACRACCVGVAPAGLSVTPPGRAAANDPGRARQMLGQH